MARHDIGEICPDLRRIEVEIDDVGQFAGGVIVVKCLATTQRVIAVDVRVRAGTRRIVGGIGGLGIGHRVRRAAGEQREHQGNCSEFVIKHHIVLCEVYSGQIGIYLKQQVTAHISGNLSNTNNAGTATTPAPVHHPARS